MKEAFEKAQKWLKDPKNKTLLIVSLLLFFYLSGLLAQFLNNRYGWYPGEDLSLPSLNPLKGLAMLFTPFGAQAMGGLFCFLLIAALLVWLNREDRSGMVYDKARNFWYSDKGAYGTAGWMNDQELRACFDVTPEEQAGEVTEVIYGIKDGMVVSRKADTRLGPHIAVMGSSGSMKSRTISRAMLMSCARKGHSLVVTDTKGELASDTMEYLKGYGYEVKVLNVVDPYNSHRYDSLEGARELPLFVSNIVEAIISNTGGGVGDPIYDAAEGDLLSALIFLCLGCSSDPVTAKFISDRSGEVTIYADTVMKQRNIFTPALLQPNYRHSEGTGRRKLLTPDEVMRLPSDKMLVMVSHEQLLELEKFDYTRNPESQKFRPVPIRGLKIVPQPVADAVGPRRPQEEPAVSWEAPPVAEKPPRTRRRKLGKEEVRKEEMQLRIDEYPWEPLPAERQEGGSPGKVQHIEKPEV